MKQFLSFTFLIVGPSYVMGPYLVLPDMTSAAFGAFFNWDIYHSIFYGSDRTIFLDVMDTVGIPRTELTCSVAVAAEVSLGVTLIPVLSKVIIAGAGAAVGACLIMAIQFFS